MTLDGNLETRTNNAVHELILRNAQSLTYDEKGNLTADTLGRAYTWDIENRLVGVAPSSPTNGSVKVAMQYDCQGRRVGKQVYQMVSNAWVQTSATLFTWDRWLLATEVSGATTNVYVNGEDLSGTIHGAGGIGGLLCNARISAGTPSLWLFAYNANGNVAAVTDGSGTVVVRYNYSPYGKILSSSGTAASSNKIRFSTKYWDDETGFGYWGHRFYDADLGRWLSRDPIGEIRSKGQISEQGTTSDNQYSVLDNDTPNLVDYLGLLKWEKKAVQGCNAGGSWETWGYVHWPTETDLPPPPWSPGSSGSFAHGCSVFAPFFNPVLCNTYTYVTIQVTNDECCEKWKVNCDWKYGAELEGSLFAMWEMKVIFLGAAPSPYPVGTRDPASGDSVSGDYSLSAWIIDSRSEIVTIPRGATKQVLWFEPVGHVYGKPNAIVEAGQASCSATCAQ